ASASTIIARLMDGSSGAPFLNLAYSARHHNPCRRQSQHRQAQRRLRPGWLTCQLAIAILSYMVNYQARLGHTFAALVDPTRRAILARLEREDAATVSELARPFAIKLPAVMKHLDVLDQAGLITRSKSGRTVTVRLRAEPIREAVEWLRRY